MPKENKSTSTRPAQENKSKNSTHLARENKSIRNSSRLAHKSSMSRISKSTTNNIKSSKPIKLKLFCLVEGEPEFSVIIRSDQTIDDLKDAIKAENENTFNGTDAKDLILKLIPNGSTVEELCKFPKESLKALDNVLEKLHTYFPDEAADNLIYIIVEVPKRVSKRDRDQLENDESDRSSSKKVKLENMSLMEAISAAGLAQKALINGDPDPSVLTSKELVSVLGNNGVRVGRTDLYYSISQTATSLQNASFQELDVISSPLGTKLPVIDTEDLYVRQTYKEFYDEIIKKYGVGGDIKAEDPQMVLTGTAGIGKSSFLVYFAIRMLATSNEEDPPIIIIQQKEGSSCYAFGGRSTIRSGEIKDFKSFLQLPSTWFLVDSSPTPLLLKSRTIFSVSPKTLLSSTKGYQEIMKKVIWKYYMAPWELDELIECKNKVRVFKEAFDSDKSRENLLEELYDKIGGVPRYVLEKPRKVFGNNGTIAKAESEALERLQLALDDLQDPSRIINHYMQGRDSMEYSSQIFHRYPTEDHEGFELRWASNHIMQKVCGLLNESTWANVLGKLVDSNPLGKGVMFQNYVQRMLRLGGRSFKAKSIDDGTEITIEVEESPKTKFFHTLDKYVKDDMEGSLWLPKSKTFACVDMLIAPKYLLQITTNKNHGIKSKNFKELLKTLQDKKWISSSDEVVFIFVVPQDMAEEFKKKTYRIGANRVDPTPTIELKNIKQYVLAVDLQDELRRCRKKAS